VLLYVCKAIASFSALVYIILKLVFIFPRPATIYGEIILNNNGENLDKIPTPPPRALISFSVFFKIGEMLFATFMMSSDLRRESKTPSHSVLNF
jgi:hypothetical protein